MGRRNPCARKDRPRKSCRRSGGRPRNVQNRRRGINGLDSPACFHRLRAGEERIRSLQLRFDRGALARRRRPKLRAQLVPFLLAVPTSMDFGGVQTSTHDDDPPSGIVTAAGGIGRRTPRHARPRATIRRHRRDAGCLSARFTSARETASGP